MTSTYYLQKAFFEAQMAEKTSISQAQPKSAMLIKKNSSVVATFAETFGLSKDQLKYRFGIREYVTWRRIEVGISRGNRLI